MNVSKVCSPPFFFKMKACDAGDYPEVVIIQPTTTTTTTEAATTSGSTRSPRECSVLLYQILRNHFDIGGETECELAEKYFGPKNLQLIGFPGFLCALLEQEIVRKGHIG